MEKQPRQASFGTISSGTMRPEDLIPAFVSELEYLLNGTANASQSALIAEANDLETSEETGYYKDEEAADEILSELADALNELAPAYGYFGASMGDGADYGFWLHEDIDQVFEWLRVDDLNEVPADYTGEVMHVNDHGNMTLYVANNGELTEVWGIV